MKNTIKLSMACSLICLLMAGICFAYDIGPFSFPKDETMVYENRVGGGKAAKVVSTYYKQGTDFVIKQTEENGNVIKTVVDKNFMPKSYKKVSKSGNLLEFCSYNKGVLKVSIPAKKILKTVDLPKTYYDTYTLFYALRKFPFAKDKIEVDVSYHDPGNIRVVKMYVKNLGKEKVKIGSGTFTCYKLEMGVAKALDRAVWPYKYNFWFTADANRHFVKFQGRERDASVIVSELAIYKIGKKYVVKKASNDSISSDKVSVSLADSNM